MGYDQSQGFVLVGLGFFLVVLGFCLVVLGFCLVGLGFYLWWEGFSLVSVWGFFRVGGVFYGGGDLF